jgi:hypothetical protein
VINDILAITKNGKLRWTGNTANLRGFNLTLADGVVTISHNGVVVDTVADTGNKLAKALGDGETAKTTSAKATFTRKLAALAAK